MLGLDKSDSSYVRPRTRVLNYFYVLSKEYLNCIPREYKNHFGG